MNSHTVLRRRYTLAEEGFVVSLVQLEIFLRISFKERREGGREGDVGLHLTRRIATSGSSQQPASTQDPTILVERYMRQGGLILAAG